MDKKEKYNFMKLMAEYDIRIPVIQRDYVQGRKNEYGVRSGFLSALYKHLKDNNPMTLDFVYGKIIEGRNGDRDTFIPLDGQQRLTTLLLLTWYFGRHSSTLKCGEDKPDGSGCSWVFDYASRRMAMCFVRFLLLSNSYDRKVKPTDWVRSQNQFVPAWENDATVSSMLQMLDDIHLKFCGLSNECVNLNIVEFYLHQCEDISEDETYLKINARGESLTEWENIKSILDARATRLLQSADELEMEARDAAEKWRKKINTEWLERIERLLTGGISLSKEDIGAITDQELEYYIALSVAVVSTAFRNVVDVAAMLSISSTKLADSFAAKSSIQEIKFLNIGDIMLGSRIEAKSVKDINDLVSYYIGVFRSHNATYEDYRDESVFTNEAFILAVRLFDAITCDDDNFVFGGWSWDRSKNRMWQSLLKEEEKFCDGSAFLRDFLFSGIHPNLKSLGVNDVKKFEEWCREQAKIIYSPVAYTYHNALRFVLLSNVKRNNVFWTTRAMNVLDFWSADEINGQNFQNRFEYLSRIQNFVGDEAAWLELINDFKNIKKDDIVFSRFLDNESIKIQHWMSDNIDFLKVENMLPQQAGLCAFTCDKNTERFDENLAEFFCDNFMINDNPCDDCGFDKMIPYFPDNPKRLWLPSVASSGKARYHAWKSFLLQNEVRDALQSLKKDSDNQSICKANEGSWKYNYKLFKDRTYYIGAMIGEWWGCVYVYNQRTRMTNGCYKLSYNNNRTLKVLDMLANGTNPFLWHNQKWISLVGANQRVEVSCRAIETIEKGDDSGCIEYRAFDTENKLRFEEGKEFHSYDELIMLIDDIRANSFSF